MSINYNSEYYISEIVKKINHLYNNHSSNIKEQTEFIFCKSNITKELFNEIKCNLTKELKNSCSLYKIGISYLSLIYKLYYIHIEHVIFSENDEVFKITILTDLRKLLELH